MEHQNKKEYRTTDLYLACFLVAMGFDLIRLEGDTGRRKVFVFGESGDISQLERSYWEGTAKVSAKRFVSTIKEMKSRIYNSN